MMPAFHKGFNENLNERESNMWKVNLLYSSWIGLKHCINKTFTKDLLIFCLYHIKLQYLSLLLLLLCICVCRNSHIQLLHRLGRVIKEKMIGFLANQELLGAPVVCLLAAGNQADWEVIMGYWPFIIIFLTVCSEPTLSVGFEWSSCFVVGVCVYLGDGGGWWKWSETNLCLKPNVFPWLFIRFLLPQGASDSS